MTKLYKPLDPRTPLLVVGLGSFGLRTLEAVKLGGHPALPQPELIWASPQGYFSGDWQSGGTGGDNAAALPDDWSIAHRSSCATCVKEALRKISSRSRAPARLGVVLAADLQEPFGRDIWQPALDLLRQYLPLPGQISVTLILSVDSPTFVDLPPEEAASLRAELAKLQQYLLAGPGPVDWCYLLDTLDIHAFPVRLADGAEVADPGVVQAHLAAELVRALNAGLGDLPAYQRTRLEMLRRNHGPGAEERGWVSIFGAARLVVSGPERGEAMRLRLAGHVLTHGLIGEERPGDAPWARETRRRWFADAGLEAPVLAARLGRDARGSPLTFPIEQPDFSSMPPDHTLQELDRWTVALEQRWKSEDAFQAAVKRNANQVLKQVESSLAALVDSNVQLRPGGALRCRLFLQEAQESIVRERGAARPAPVPRFRGKALLSMLAALGRRIGIFPPADEWATARAGLEPALQSRLAGAQRWRQALAQGLHNTRRLLVGYLVFAVLSLIPGLLFGLLALHPFLLAVLLALVWLRVLLPPTLTAFYAELRWQIAIARVIRAVRKKVYEQMQQTIQNEVWRVFGEGQEWLEAWVRKVDTHIAVLEAAAGSLKTAAPQRMAKIFTEWRVQLMNPSSELEKLFSSEEAVRMAETFLQQNTRAGWQVESPESLVAALLEFASQQLEGLSPAPDFQSRLEAARQCASGPGIAADELPEEAWIRALSVAARPAFPLGMETPPGGFLRQVFAGFPVNVARIDGEEFLESADSMDARASEALCRYITDDPDGLSVVTTIHALDMQRMKVWSFLAAVEPAGEAISAANSGE